MSRLAVIVLFSWIAGLAAFLGGVLARLEGTVETEGKREFVHGVVALGGGILVAAISFVLAPEGIAILSTAWLVYSFLLGGLLFCSLDVYLSKRGGSKAQFMAMLMDFIPEAIALGALFGHNHNLGILLALFIGAQNLPEGFNSFRESVEGHVSTKATLIALLAISVLGPIAACIGYLFLQDRHTLTAGIMSFAGGGILYLIFQDIAPQAKMRRHWVPALGAVLGFLIGMLGKKILG